MSLTFKDLDYVIELAHLDIPQEDKEKYLSQLQKILGHMDSLNRLPLDAYAPATSPDWSDPFFREDVVKPHAELLLEENAPAWEDGCFQVPKMGE